MMVLVVPAVLAGFLGILAHQAGDAAAYLPRLRLLFLGAAALGYVGVGIFCLKKLRGWRLAGALVVALVALRVCYLPILSLALLVTGWLDWLGRTAFSATNLDGPIHYALACFVAAFSSLAALLLISAVSHLKQIGWVMVLLVYVGLGVLAFWHAPDRLNPHPFLSEAPPRATRGPGYFDVVEDSKRPVVTRVLAAGGLIRHALFPRSGWGGAIREELLARYRGDPGMTLSARVKCIEAALVNSRRLLRTSPRTLP